MSWPNSTLCRTWRSKPCTQPHFNPASGWGMWTIPSSSGPMESRTCNSLMHTSTSHPPTFHSPLRERRKGGLHSGMYWWHAAKTDCRSTAVQETNPYGSVHPIPFSPPSQNTNRSDARHVWQRPLNLWQHLAECLKLMGSQRNWSGRP